MHDDLGFWTARGEPFQVSAVDMADALEFYFAMGPMIWRSRLGRYFWNVHIAPALLQCNGHRNMDFADDLINCTKLVSPANTVDVALDSKPLDSKCRMCAKNFEHAEMQIVDCEPHEFNVRAHEQCVATMQLLIDIGNFFREFRKQPEFSPQCLVMIQDFLQTLSPKNVTHTSNNKRKHED